MTSPQESGKTRSGFELDNGTAGISANTYYSQPNKDKKAEIRKIWDAKNECLRFEPDICTRCERIRQTVELLDTYAKEAVEEARKEFDYYENLPCEHLSQDSRRNCMSCLHKAIDSLNKMVTEARIEASNAHALGRKEMREEIVGLLDKIKSPYPIDIFSNPWEGWQKDLDKFAKSHGKRMDNISAWYGRWSYKNVLHDFKTLIDDASLPPEGEMKK